MALTVRIAALGTREEESSDVTNMRSALFSSVVTVSLQSQLPDCSATFDRLNELKLSRRSLKYLEVISKVAFSLALPSWLLSSLVPPIQRIVAFKFNSHPIVTNSLVDVKCYYHIHNSNAFNTSFGVLDSQGVLLCSSHLLWPI